MRPGSPPRDSGPHTCGGGARRHRTTAEYPSVTAFHCVSPGGGPVDPPGTEYAQPPMQIDSQICSLWNFQHTGLPARLPRISLITPPGARRPKWGSVTLAPGW